MSATHALGRQWMRADELHPNEEYTGKLAHLHEDRINELAQSISEHGYREDLADDPIVVAHDSEGTAHVWEGSHRVHAARAVGYKKPLPVEVIDSKKLLG